MAAPMLIVTGPPGVGRSTTVRAIAAAGPTAIARQTLARFRTGDMQLAVDHGA